MGGQFIEPLAPLAAFRHCYYLHNISVCSFLTENKLMMMISSEKTYFQSCLSSWLQMHRAVLRAIIAPLHGFLVLLLTNF